MQPEYGGASDSDAGFRSMSSEVYDQNVLAVEDDDDDDGEDDDRDGDVDVDMRSRGYMFRGEFKEY